ncbi:hypothetical protein [Streptomyces griseosporeus]|uniref:hypothetical protein n=1 Tax=Streptomyces griseosporeus TaxID=1910 RepID=UPI0036FADD56
MTSYSVRNAIAPLGEGMLSRTFAYGTGSRNSYLIFAAAFVACVINGESITGLLTKVTWLVVAVIILTVVQAADRLTYRRVGSLGVR